MPSSAQGLEVLVPRWAACSSPNMQCLPHNVQSMKNSPILTSKLPRLVICSSDRPNGTTGAFLRNVPRDAGRYQLRRSDGGNTEGRSEEEQEEEHQSAAWGVWA